MWTKVVLQSKQRDKRQKHVFNTQIKSPATKYCKINTTMPVLWLCGNNPDYFTAWLNTPLGEMWHNGNSCSTLFWRLAQWQCTSNPEMNFSANPDYHTAHPPRKHTHQALFKEDENILLAGLRTAYHTQCPNSNHKYCAHGMLTIACTQITYFGLTQTYLQLSLSPASCPFLGTFEKS